MRAIAAAFAVLLSISVSVVNACAEESRITVGSIDAILTIPPGVERPPVALLIAGSGSTDHDGNGPQIKPATLKKLQDRMPQASVINSYGLTEAGPAFITMPKDEAPKRIGSVGKPMAPMEVKVVDPDTDDHRVIIRP